MAAISVKRSIEGYGLYLHSKRLIWANFWFNISRCNTEPKRTHLVTRRNMGCFQGLAILIVVCTVIICALQILCFFLLKRTRNASSLRINEDLNGYNHEPGNLGEINIQWPHMNRRKQPIEHQSGRLHDHDIVWTNVTTKIIYIFLFPA